MKYPYLPLLGAALLFSSCAVETGSSTIWSNSLTLEGSLDAVKVRENGTSKLTYNSQTKENLVVWEEWYVLGVPMRTNSAESFSEQPGAPKPDPNDIPSLGIRAGLEYVGKGAKFPTTGGDLKINLNYLEIPVDAVYHLPAGPGQIQAGLGPYFAYGIGGSTGGSSSFGENNGGFKRFDAGLNFLLGYKLPSGWSLRLGYDLGLANVEYASEDVSGHTRTFSVNVGYQIGKLFGKK